MKNASLEYSGFIPHHEYETTEIRMHHSHVEGDIIIDIEVQDGLNSPNSRVTLSAKEIDHIKTMIGSFTQSLEKMQVTSNGN